MQRPQRAPRRRRRDARRRECRTTSIATRVPRAAAIGPAGRPAPAVRCAEGDRTAAQATLASSTRVCRRNTSAPRPAFERHARAVPCAGTAPGATARATSAALETLPPCTRSTSASASRSDDPAIVIAARAPAAADVRDREAEVVRAQSPRPGRRGVARCRRFWSSRTLPGQPWASSARSADGASSGPEPPLARAASDAQSAGCRRGGRAAAGRRVRSRSGGSTGPRGTGPPRSPPAGATLVAHRAAARRRAATCSIRAARIRRSAARAAASPARAATGCRSRRGRACRRARPRSGRPGAAVRPVKAPASAPNSSASSSVSGSAPTLTVTNARPARVEFAWMISAIFSLPAPFGPVISTGTSAAATCTARSTRRAMASLSIDEAAEVRLAGAGRPQPTATHRRRTLPRCASRIASSSRTRRHEPAVVPRFAEVVGRPCLHQRDRAFERREGRHQQHRHRRIDGCGWRGTAPRLRRPTSRPARSSCPARPRRRRRIGPSRGRRRRPRRRHVGHVVQREQHLQRLGDRRLILDDEAEQGALESRAVGYGRRRQMFRVASAGATRAPRRAGHSVASSPAVHSSTAPMASSPGVMLRAVDLVAAASCSASQRQADAEHDADRGRDPVLEQEVTEDVAAAGRRGRGACRSAVSARPPRTTSAP